MPTLRHPKLPAEQTYDCLDSQVEVFAASGWVVVDADEETATDPEHADSAPGTDAAPRDVDTTRPGTRR